MNELVELKSLIDSLQRRRAGFKNQLAEFKILQQEIAVLQQNSGSDPVARSKLQKLDLVMKSGGQQLHQQIISNVAKAEKTFANLGKQLKQLAPDEGKSALSGAVPAKPVVVKKLRRAFV